MGRRGYLFCKVTALGPWVNLARGLARYPWLRFSFWDALGEYLGVALM
jgi:hypothetical protein